MKRHFGVVVFKTKCNINLTYLSIKILIFTKIFRNFKQVKQKHKMAKNFIDLEFLETGYKNKSLIVDNYQFNFHKNNEDKTITYRCKYYQTRECKLSCTIIKCEGIDKGYFTRPTLGTHKNIQS